MGVMNGLYAEYREYNAKYTARKDELERLISRHKRSLERLEHGHQGWFDRVLVPLAVHISAELGGIPYKFYGPLGLNCETTVYFFPNRGRVEDHDICKDETYSLTVYPNWRHTSGFYLTYDTGRRTDKYKPGSIGWLNGFNNVQEELPDDFDEIMALLSHSHAKEEEL